MEFAKKAAGPARAGEQKEVKALEESSKKMKTLEQLKPHMGSIQIERIHSSSLDKLPLAQQRTGRAKKFSRVDFEKKLAIKGPYKADDKKFIYAIKYNLLLQKLDTNTESKTAWPWVKLYTDENDMYYLVSEFVSDKVMIESERQKRMLSIEDWSGKVVNYFARDAEVLGYRILDILRRAKRGEAETLLNDRLKRDILQHLYLRYVLGVGDAGGQNILYVDREKNPDQLVAGIDLEEFRPLHGLNRDTPYRMLFNTPHKTYLSLFEDVMDSITFIDWDKSDLSEQLSQFLEEEQILGMLQRDDKLRKLFEK